MKLLCSFLLFFVSLSPSLQAEQVLTSSVSPEFSNGLHARYLDFISQKVDARLELKPMPLARRLKELKKGNLDILVLSQREGEGLTFLQPAYEVIQTGVFVRRDDIERVNDYRHLTSFKVGYSIGARLFPRFDRDLEIEKVAVSSLEQKILLLDRGRIDAFIHSPQSAVETLRVMGLDRHIGKSSWQPQYQRHYHFVISDKSLWYRQKHLLERAIETALSQGQFARIRQQFYQHRETQLSSLSPPAN